MRAAISPTRSEPSFAQRLRIQRPHRMTGRRPDSRVMGHGSSHRHEAGGGRREAERAEGPIDCIHGEKPLRGNDADSCNLAAVRNRNAAARASRACYVDYWSLISSWAVKNCPSRMIRFASVMADRGIRDLKLSIAAESRDGRSRAAGRRTQPMTIGPGGGLYFTIGRFTIAPVFAVQIDCFGVNIRFSSPPVTGVWTGLGATRKTCPFRAS
jgi:hypothetical protein